MTSGWTIRWILRCGLAASVSLFTVTALAAAEEGSDRAITSILETFRQMPGCSRAGIALGVNNAGHQTVYTIGSVYFLDGHSEQVTATTDFQIGSVTKTYTATVYAQLVAEGKLKPESLVRDFLPPGTLLPGYKDPITNDVTDITIDELARHTSGLPRQQPIGSSAFNDSQLLSTLDRVSLRTKPGTKYVDSQLGIALLAKVLERATGQTLEDLVATRITQPMHLEHTRFYHEGDTVLPIGFDRANQLADPVTIGWPAYAGSSALISNLDDMMSFMSANMGREAASNPVARVLDQLQKWQTVPCASPQEGGQGCASIETGLTWSRLGSKVPGLSTVWKNGTTKGFAAWIGFVAPNPGEMSPAGVVALASQSSCPVGPLASCALASVSGHPLAPVCLPTKLSQ